MAAASSSTIPQQKKYDVFISFRGADVRHNFLSHLNKTLLDNLVNTFVDENLDRGEEISSSLLKTIEESCISIVIFSENYASSPWCLDELIKIIECTKTMEQMVLPVFYHVDPTIVQEVTGSFGDSLAKHKEEFKDSLHKVESWSQALKETGGMSGFVSHDIKNDSELIAKIVSWISEKVDLMFPSDPINDGLVGIDSRVKDFESLLGLEMADVRYVGIWGMAGIGKTTLAREVFNRIFYQFTIKCFVEDVRDNFHKCGPDGLRRLILSQALGRENSNVGMPIMLLSSIRRRLCREKILLVLDDVSDVREIELSIGKCAVFGPGSRIIITSRDQQLLKYMGAEIYKVKKLNDDEASQLFCFHAFRRDISTEEYMELSKRAVEYAQGTPLALEVLGSNLYGRSVGEWEDELEKLKGTSDPKIHGILKLSYDGLSKDDKEIFLDIACFFKGQDRDYVEKMLDSPGSKIGISRLLDKSIISVIDNRVHMHDLLQQMGKDIICQEKQLGQRSRLWDPKDIYYLFTRAEGTEAIKGILLDMSKIKDLELTLNAFEKMYNLKFLKFYCSILHWNRVKLPEGLNFLPDELRLLQWYEYPLESVPWSSCAENLVEIRMVRSKLKQLWNGDQHLGNLKFVDLSYSKDLMSIPDLSTIPNLEVLRLSFCKSLIEIPLSIKYLSKLKKLYLRHCQSLCNLPSFLHLKNLEILSIFGCSKIREFPEVPCAIRDLDLEGTIVERVPLSIGYLPCLSNLALSSCTRLTCLPDSICNLKSLRHFSIYDSVNLLELPENLGNLESLRKLSVGKSGIKELPDSICNLKKLIFLSIEKCVNLHYLPENLGNLESLERLIANDSGIKELPESICNLKKLTCLSTARCENLQSLPENLGYLESLDELRAFGPGLKRLPDGICNVKELRFINVGGCINLNELPECLGNLESLELLVVSHSGIKKLPSSVNQLSNLRSLHLGGCKGLMIPALTGLSHLFEVVLEFCGLLEFPNNICNLVSLRTLYIGGNDFESIPDTIKHLSNLIKLDLSHCKRLKYLPELPSLSMLYARNCTVLKSASSLFQLRSIKHLDLRDCLNLEDKIVDHLLASSWQRELLFCIPGREVPKWIKYQNNSGSRLSFPFSQLKRAEFTRFIYCAVFDPKVYHPFPCRGSLQIGFEGINESGHGQYHFCNYWKNHIRISSDASYLRSEHVFLWSSFGRHSHFREKNMTLQFFSEEILSRVDSNKRRRSYSGIIKCGFHLE